MCADKGDTSMSIAKAESLQIWTEALTTERLVEALRDSLLRPTAFPRATRAALIFEAANRLERSLAAPERAS